MNRYIIVTQNILRVGGLELFTSGKAEYLEKERWKVDVLYIGHKRRGHCAIPSLNKYLNGGFIELGLPPYMFTSKQRKKALDRIMKYLNPSLPAENIYIESHSDTTSQWAELIAEKMGGKHVFLLCNEYFRGHGKHYEECMDFYDFKHKRREVAGEVENEMQKLFEGYKIVPQSECYLFDLDEDPVRDIPSQKIDSISHYDFNICYIGRATKSYVPEILADVAKFAGSVPDKTVQLVLVGDASSQSERLTAIKNLHPGLIVTELGNLVPIPRSLFSKVDVVIAGSGSANCAVHEGIPVILADTETRRSNGLLGYETKNFLFSDETTISKTFMESLEDVFIRRIQDRLEFDYPPRKGPAECQKQNFTLFERAVQTVEYYGEEKLCILSPNTKAVRKLYFFDFLFNRMHPLLKFFGKAAY